MGSRLLVFDRTCVRGLSHVWSMGSHLYRGLGRIDAARGVASWDEALDWLAEASAPIDEVQYWGHGRWGLAMAGDDVLDARSLAASHPRHARLKALAERLSPGALIWFRTCETFGAARGIDFAARLSDLLGARVAGHTFRVAFHQSGLHGLAPGARPDWSPEEGLAEGSGREPKRSKMSTPLAPRTITCLEGRVPDAWFAMR